MSESTITELKALFKQASEIAQLVPENMQEAAFNRALDILMQSLTYKGNEIAGNNADNKMAHTLDVTAEKDDILSAIDPTNYPDIRVSSKVLDRSLMILEIAYKEYGIDGLTPGNIAEILTNRFNINTKSTAICNALDLAPSLARRISDGTRFIYKIMLAGEEYLINLEQNPRS